MILLKSIISLASSEPFTLTSVLEESVAPSFFQLVDTLAIVKAPTIKNTFSLLIFSVFQCLCFKYRIKSTKTNKTLR